MAPAPSRGDPADRTNGLDVELGFTVGLGLPFEESIEWAEREGFDFVELLLDGPYARERILDRRESMREALESAGIGLVVHLPFALDPGSPSTPVREGAVAELEAGMDLAVDLGAKSVVFHPASDPWEFAWSHEECLPFLHESLDELVPAARDRGLEPCVENVVSSYYDATTFPELLERYPAASMTFDTSHALLAGLSTDDMASFCRDHADRIAHLHLVDTRGSVDEHLPVGMGTIEFEALFDALDAVGWSGTATLEIGTEDYDTIALGKRHAEELLANY